MAARQLSASIPRHTVTLINHDPFVSCCHGCGATENLITCACTFARFCRHDHGCGKGHGGQQRRGRHKKAHQVLCHNIRDCLAEVSAAHDVLPPLPYDNPFASQEGFIAFWQRRGISTYLDAQYELVQVLSRLDTYESVLRRLECCQMFLRARYRPSSCMEDAQIIPVLMLQLGREEDAYTMLEYLGICSRSRGGWQHDCDAAIAKLRNAHGSSHLSVSSLTLLNVPRDRQDHYAMALILVKIQILLDLQDLRNSTTLYEKFAPELVLLIQRFIPRSAMVIKHWQFRRAETWDDTIAVLEQQIWWIYGRLDQELPVFWPRLTYSESAGPPDSVMHRHDRRRARRFLITCSPLWRVYPAAFEYVRKLGQ